MLKDTQRRLVRLALLATALLALGALLTGCGEKIMSPEEYAKINIEMMTERMKNMNPATPGAGPMDMRKSMLAILSKHGYTEKDFTASGKALMKNPATAQRVQTLISEGLKAAMTTNGMPGAPAPGPGGAPAPAPPTAPK